MSVHNDIGPTMEILMAAIAKELGVLQDELPPAIESILFNALFDTWNTGNKAAYSRPTIPAKPKTNPAFPPPILDPNNPNDPNEEITRVTGMPRKKPT